MGDNLYHEYDRLAPLLAAAPNLKHLAIPIVTGVLRNPFNIPELARLEKLDFSEDNSDDAEEETEKWSLATGWAILCQAKDSLRDVALEASNHIPYESTSLPLDSAISTLACFTQVSALSISGRCLDPIFRGCMINVAGRVLDKTDNSQLEEVAKRIFPLKIQRITIWDLMNLSIDLLGVLARAKRRSPGLYTCLRMVSIRASPSNRHWVPKVYMRQEIERLVPAFAGTEVNLDVDVRGHPGWPVTASW
ncbi:hypothetical protein BDV19DRAFT_394461 [Aspergillus venezuelensis]